MDAKAITPTMQYEIQKMELEAGLPTGFYANIAKTNPDSKVISSTTRESGGSKYADVIMQNPDGSLMVKQIALGASQTSSSASNSEEKEIKSFQSDAADFIVKLESKEIGWGAAFNALKAKYPQASNELIDQTLNKTQYYTTEREDSMY
jgi:hypothetical protein